MICESKLARDLTIIMKLLAREFDKNSKKNGPVHIFIQNTNDGQEYLDFLLFMKKNMHHNRKLFFQNEMKEKKTI